MISIGFCPNSNQTADKWTKLEKISHFSKYLILFLLSIYYLADRGNLDTLLVDHKYWNCEWCYNFATVFFTKKNHFSLEHYLAH